MWSFRTVWNRYFNIHHESGLPCPNLDCEPVVPFPDPDSEGHPYNQSAVYDFLHIMKQIKPYLDGATPYMLPVGLVFSEATRFRYDRWDRFSYLQAMYKLYKGLLARYSLSAEIINAVDLSAGRIASLAAVVVLESSGLTSTQIEALKEYAVAGGTLIIAGDGLRYNGTALVRVVGVLLGVPRRRTPDGGNNQTRYNQPQLTPSQVPPRRRKLDAGHEVPVQVPQI